MKVTLLVDGSPEVGVAVRTRSDGLITEEGGRGPADDRGRFSPPPPCKWAVSSTDAPRFTPSFLSKGNIQLQGTDTGGKPHPRGSKLQRRQSPYLEGWGRRQKVMISLCADSNRCLSTRRRCNSLQKPLVRGKTMRVFSVHY